MDYVGTNPAKSSLSVAVAEMANKNAIANKCM